MSNLATVPSENKSGSADSDIKRLAEALYRERVAEARNMPAEEKLLAGEELFDFACSITLAGIWAEFQDCSDEERLRILEARLDLRERMEHRG